MFFFKKIYLKFFSGFELRSRYHKYIFLIFKFPLTFLFFPAVLILRLISPFLIIRLGAIITDSIGHLVENTELYCCEKKANINVIKNKKYIDLFYLDRKPYSNMQIIKMWKRELLIFPKFLIKNIKLANRFFPGHKKYEINNNTQGDRDIHNLYEKYSPHIKFTNEEKIKGALLLKNLGIPENRKFICLIVRDEKYLKKHIPWFDGNYHRHRNSDIETYKFAAKELAKLGFYVLRMGVNVEKVFNCDDPKIIDYANSEFRSEFGDVYLGANCHFCISTHTGFDGIPQIFNRPILFTNLVPIGFLPSWCKNSICLFKKHIDVTSDKALSLKEIFKKELVNCFKFSDYSDKNIYLKDNTDDEIKDACLEMAEKLKENSLNEVCEDYLQKKFKEIYRLGVLKNKINNKAMHGKIKISYSQSFLKKNSEWVN